MFTIGATGAATLAYGLVEAQAFTTRELELAVLPEGSENIRVLHISDLHITPAQTRKINWVKSLVKLEPDFVVGTGDFLAHSLAVPAVVEAMDELMDIPGAFVLGSNDYFAPTLKNPLQYFNKSRVIQAGGTPLPTSELVEQLTDAGWLDLNNKQSQVTIKGVKIHARGTDDPHVKKDNYAAVSGMFANDTFALGVTHAPYRRVLESFATDNAHLVLAGHTHGGQICLPFYGALITNCDLPQRQAKGFSKFGDSKMPLHVSAGVGTSPFTPIRIACRPEATLLTLTAKNT
ncbi:MAG: metallophosphoesterase [Candidatus Nanopelagicales bacterium]|nr:metallophosphoesterase [Candidatus Nanopelagicales bacterium]MDP4895641.1 metallophosphoesterase [Candidatus Nanopelagicales bacterium]